MERQVSLVDSLKPGVYTYYIEIDGITPQDIHVSLFGTTLLSRQLIRDTREKYLQLYIYWLGVSGGGIVHKAVT